MFILTAEQMRKEEERGFSQGVTYEKMMRTAGENTADVVLKEYGSLKVFTVVCGKGRNGGDGFVAACKLAKKDKRVYVVLAMGKPSDSLCLKMYGNLIKNGITVMDFTKDPEKCYSLITKTECLIDAVFGIGFSGKLSGRMVNIANVYNSVKCPKVAVDIPSGLLCDSNLVSDLYFHADITVTMHALKPVHRYYPSKQVCGKIYIVGIGFDIGDGAGHVKYTDLQYVRSKFPQREVNSHKGTFGYALSVCGSYLMPGAASLAAKAAVECGAGIVAAAFPDKAYPAITAKLWEQIFVPCPSDEKGFFSSESSELIKPYLDKASAVLFGCGVGVGDGSAELLEFILKNSKCPVIIDADGINILSLNINLLKECKSHCVLTPHPGEMSRLIGKDVKYVNDNRMEVAKSFADKYSVTLLLKGHNTVIATKNGKCFVNTNGNAGMATGGSGDMLSGIILSLAAQGMNAADAAVCGAFIHGAAGDIASDTYSMAGTTPLRCIESLPYILLDIEK